MLYLKPLNGTWYIMSTGFPGGHWAAYNDPDAALVFMEWMFDQHIDCTGILQRLYLGMLTERDRVIVQRINHASKHTTRVWSEKEPVLYALMKTRLKPTKLANN